MTESLVAKIALMLACNVGNITERSSHIWNILSLVWLRAGQTASKCSKVPGVVGQHGALQKPLLLLFQCLVSMAVRYLPETILANTVLFEHSNGLIAAVLHI